MGTTGLPTRAARAAVGPVEVLRHEVTESDLPVALFDLVSSRVLAASARGRELIGLVDVDLETHDFVLASVDPDAVRRLVDLILSARLREWRMPSLLYTPDGRRIEGEGVGRFIGEYGPHKLCIGWWAVGEDSATHAAEIGRWLRGERFDHVAARAREREGAARELASRVRELESHLSRIASELENAGLVTAPRSVALDRAAAAALSARERDVVRRLVEGERVPMIARNLGLRPATVRNHLVSVYRKFGVRSQYELIELLTVDENAERANTPSG